MFKDVVIYLPDVATSTYTRKTYFRTTRNQLAGLAQKGYESAVPVSEQPSKLLFASEGQAVYNIDDVPLCDGAQLAVVLDSPSVAHRVKDTLGLPDKVGLVSKLVSMRSTELF